MKKFLFIVAFVSIAMFLPHIADACPLCQGGQGYSPKTLTAYKSITAVLASLPLIMGGGIFWYLRKKFRNAEKEEEID